MDNMNDSFICIFCNKVALFTVRCGGFLFLYLYLYLLVNIFLFLYLRMSYLHLYLYFYACVFLSLVSTSMSLFVFLATKLLCLQRSVAVFCCIFSCVCLCFYISTCAMHVVLRSKGNSLMIRSSSAVMYLCLCQLYMYVYLYSFACLLVSQPAQCMLC